MEKIVVTQEELKKLEDWILEETKQPDVEESKLPIDEESKLSDEKPSRAENCLNGTSSDPSWPQPKVVFASNKLARPDMGHYSKTATIFKDPASTLILKVKQMAILIQSCKNVVIYTGAGISTAAGIGDIASSAKDRSGLNRLQALPTTTHHILVSMYNKGLFNYWIQQNHDGLAQKAGFPKSALNEIHGSWFDKKNGVKMMDDNLDPKNIKSLYEWLQKEELCIAIGTSLSGLHADIIAEKAPKLVIINNQETRLHKKSNLNIFGDINEIFTLLAKILKIKVVKNPRVYDQTEFKK